MSTDRDINRIVRSWLEDGATALPDRVLDAVLDQLPTTPQRRSWWPARRYPIMNNTALRYAAAAAAVVAAVAIGGYLLGGFSLLPRGNNLGDTSPTPTATPLPTATPEPTPAVLNNQPSLEAGVYEAAVAGDASIRLSVSVPQGWSAFEDWALNGPDDVLPPDGFGLGFWAVENLYADPRGSELLSPAVGPSVDDLIDALVSHPGWTTTEPTEITIDGFIGRYLELTVPTGELFGGCDPNVGFLLWTTPAGGWRCAQSPGQIHHIYVIDVDGARVVIVGLSYPGTPAEDVATLRSVIDSIQVI